MCTHLFNAMPPFHPREPGLIGVLGSTAQPAPYFGLIADGVHVHPASLKIAARARPDSVVLVSDAILAMGLPQGTYSFGDIRIDVTGNDTAYRHGTSTLAGAVVPLDECVRRFRTLCDSSVVHALEAASLHAAKVLGIESSKGSLEVGCDADLVLLDDDLHVLQTYIAGELVWPLPIDATRAAGVTDESPPLPSTPEGAPLAPAWGMGSSQGAAPGVGAAKKRKQR